MAEAKFGTATYMDGIGNPVGWVDVGTLLVLGEHLDEAYIYDANDGAAQEDETELPWVIEVSNGHQFAGFSTEQNAEGFLRFITNEKDEQFFRQSTGQEAKA